MTSTAMPREEGIRALFAPVVVPMSDVEEQKMKAALEKAKKVMVLEEKLLDWNFSKTTRNF